jgi:hypothetical protein
MQSENNSGVTKKFNKPFCFSPERQITRITLYNFVISTEEKSSRKQYVISPPSMTKLNRMVNNRPPIL